eukprot:GILK01012478.1.p1 GENE.GILK01012478.1~~GILK01012478.1.p1  ORF type:complete len:268 (-),score=38.41 GILK01012478.1:242-1045(-)
MEISFGEDDAFSDRHNDLLVTVREHAKYLMVFFPGDITDWEVNTIPEFKKYSLEGLQAILSSKFPFATIMIIRPNQYTQQFACYTNFLDVDILGSPRNGYDCQGHATRYLMRLLARAKEEYHDEGFLTHKIALLGFSKGGVVLNQLVAESAQEDQQPFWSRVSSIHYLDVGVNLAGAYLQDIDSTAALQKATSQQGMDACFQGVHIHVTPRTVRDPNRLWLVAERDLFVQYLRSSGVTVYITEYFKHEPPSLSNHFKLLDAFVSPLL